MLVLVSCVALGLLLWVVRGLGMLAVCVLVGELCGFCV